MKTQIKTLLDRAVSIQDHVVDLRRTIHRNPERGFAEHQTSRLVEDELKSIGGFTIRRVAGTGIIADIGPDNSHSENAGQARLGLLLRADMDALELDEETGVEYASQVRGMMHACGHDAHTAILLGAARVISENVETLDRRIRLVFQPSEETHPGGALSLIEAGALEGIEAAVALHVYPQEPVGTIALKAGPMMANSDDFDIIFTGDFGHASAPHQSRDALVAAADFITQIQKIVSRRVDPFESVVVTVGKITAGTRRNIIAGEARLEGTIRTLNPAMRELGRRLLENAARAAAEMTDVKQALTYIEGYPVVVNDETMVNYIEKLAEDVLSVIDVPGKERVRHLKNPSMGGEDFAYFAERVPSCFFRLGSGGNNPSTHFLHHNTRFNIDESCLPIGVALMSGAAMRWKGLGPGPRQ